MKIDRNSVLLAVGTVILFGAAVRFSGATVRIEAQRQFRIYLTERIVSSEAALSRSWRLPTESVRQAVNDRERLHMKTAQERLDVLNAEGPNDWLLMLNLAILITVPPCLGVVIRRKLRKTRCPNNAQDRIFNPRCAG